MKLIRLSRRPLWAHKHRALRIVHKGNPFVPSAGFYSYSGEEPAHHVHFHCSRQRAVELWGEYPDEAKRAILACATVSFDE
jgi:hypothetical protein